MSLPRTISVVGAIGLASALLDCKVDLCDRYPNDSTCLSDMGQQTQLQVSPLRIPLPVTPAMLNITLLSAPSTPQKITLVQNGKMVDLGTISTATTTISPNLRTQVLPGPATIQVGTQQVAVRLYVPPDFTQAIVPRPVNMDLGTPAQQPVSPTALGVTPSGQIIMLGQYGTSPAFQGLKAYVLNGSLIDVATTPNLSLLTGSRYPSPSGFALTANHIYFPFQIPGNQPTDIKQIDTVSGVQVKENFFPFSALSLFTADSTGQIIAALTTDMGSSTKKLNWFSAADLSLSTSATIDTPLDTMTLTLLGAGDFSGDKIADLAAWDTAGNVKVYLGTDGQKVSLKYNAVYSTNLTTASKKLGAVPASIAVGDLDGDQVSDVALVAPAGNVALVLNELDGNFGTPLSVPTPAGFTSPSALAIGNANMDAALQSNDLVIANNDTSSKLIGVLVNQATKNWPN